MYDLISCVFQNNSLLTKLRHMKSFKNKECKLHFDSSMFKVTVNLIFYALLLLLLFLNFD